MAKPYLAHVLLVLAKSYNVQQAVVVLCVLYFSIFCFCSLLCFFIFVRVLCFFVVVSCLVLHEKMLRSVLCCGLTVDL